jgi:transcriptional regulator with XRE-family HTH domain
MNVGENIKKLRELKNYTQKSMADMLEVSQKTYSNIENAGNSISIDLVERIAKILKVSFHNILELNADAIINNHHQNGGLSQLNTAPSYNYLNEKQNELFEKLLKEKDLRICQLEDSMKFKDDFILSLKNNRK